MSSSPDHAALVRASIDPKRPVVYVLRPGGGVPYPLTEMSDEIAKCAADVWAIIQAEGLAGFWVLESHGVITPPGERSCYGWNGE